MNIDLTQGDLENLAQGLAALTDLRVNHGFQVPLFVFDDLEFVLDWTDEGGYTLDSVK